MFSRRFATAVSLVVTVIVLMGVGASSALAETHPFVRSFGSFSNPNGIAVDESTGDVYVADIGPDAVYKFDANGNPVDFSSLGSNALSGSATPAGSFSFPSVYGTPAAVAVDNSTSASDPSAGDLYVLDAGHEVIDKFSPTGAYMSQIKGFSAKVLGVGVDASGDVRVLLEGGTIDLFDSSMTNGLMREMVQGGDGSFSAVPGFAVAPTGDGYPLLSSCDCLAKLGGNDEQLGKVDSGSPSEPGSDVAVAFDPATDHAFVDDQSSVDEWDTGDMNGNDGNGLVEVPGTGTLVSTFGGLQLSSSAGQQGGIAVNGASGDIYVSNPADGKVYVFASTAPAVAVETPANVTTTGATLEGTINPRGLVVASCRFEYEISIFHPEHGELRVPVASFGHSVPCEQTPAQIGSGASAVRVSADISGLQPGNLYDFRLSAENTDGGSLTSGRLATTGPGFGIKSFEVAFLNKDGSADTQAGSHPYEMTTNIAVNTTVLRNELDADSRYGLQPDGTFKDVIVDLPSGLVGDPNATTKKCTLREMDVTGEKLGESAAPGFEACPVESAIGELEVEFGGVEKIFNIREPIYNMVPPRGVAAQIGSHFLIPNVFINVGVQAGGDYPVQAEALEAPVVEPVIVTRLNVFGVVGSGETSKAFLTLPTGCNGLLRSSISMDSYQNPGHYVSAAAVTRNAAGQPVALSGCSKLLFPPKISVSPDTTDASTSSGLTVGVNVPQKAAQNPEGLAESSLRNTTVTLPEGVALNPSGADGLEACSEGLAGFAGFDEFNSEFEPGVKTATFTPAPIEQLQPGVSFCPNGSKIGTVKIKTPLLEHELEGAVYLASQNANPFGSLVAMYLIAEDPVSGTIIKLTGEVSLNKETGQIVTTFKNTPDLPFENLELHFFGGERAPLATPSRCGTYTTTAVFTPWDGNGPVTSESSFNIDHGPGGGPCPGATLPFSPTVSAGATNIQAGAFSPLTVTVNRSDGEQNLKSVEAKLPPGLSGVLAGVELCPEPRANEGLCGENSKVGEATISVGVGNQPFTVTGGKFYLTGPYNGSGGCTVGEAGCAPFGLTFEVPAKAGPFDLANTTNNHPPCDCVVVRGKIELNPVTSAITITSNPPGSPDSIPTSIEGIPLEIQHVNATTTRGDFQFNPTNCSKMPLTATLQLSEGGTSTISTPFQVTNCAALKFTPGFAVSTSGKTSKANGASLTAKITYPAPFNSYANIAKVKVDLPKQLPSRLTTLQKACTAAQFEANPAGCPAASVIGHAKAITPLVPVPLEGPAYFVSHGGEAFPDLEMVLQGYGVKIILTGNTFISKAGITSSTFNAVPDQPVTSFELTLPEGKYSALAANGSLCSLTKTATVKKKVTVKVHGKKKIVTRKVKETQPASLEMPTAFVGQNGAEIHQNTPIGVTGCVKSKPAKKAKKGKNRKRAKKKK